MRKVIANEWMSLDGIIQSGGSDDDLTGRPMKAGLARLRGFGADLRKIA